MGGSRSRSPERRLWFDIGIACLVPGVQLALLVAAGALRASPASGAVIVALVLAQGVPPQPVVDPDYSRIFVTRQAVGGEGLDRTMQSDVGLADVLAGLGEDTRLRDAVLATISAD